MAYNDPTTNYSWNLPAVGGDSGAWGTLLNEIFGNPTTGVDKVVGDISTVANAALPKAGGTMTGRQTQKSEAHTAVNLGASLSGAVTIDLSLGNFFYGKLRGNITVTFTNPPAAGTGYFFSVELDNGSLLGVGVSWPASVKVGTNVGAMSSSIVNQKNLFSWYTRDGGTTYRGDRVLVTTA